MRGSHELHEDSTKILTNKLGKQHKKRSAGAD